MTYLLAYVLHGIDGRHSFCRLHGLPPAQVLKKPGVRPEPRSQGFSHCNANTLLRRSPIEGMGANR
jgi:hypothetical protein